MEIIFKQDSIKSNILFHSRDRLILLVLILLFISDEISGKWGPRSFSTLRPIVFYWVIPEGKYN